MEIYKGDPNNNDLMGNPNELPYPEEDFVYTAWLNYTKGFQAAYEAGRQNEREECAKLVDHILKEGGGTYGDAIRSRG